MKGLHEYIRKYGVHFTEDLALSITSGNFDSKVIINKTQNKVYYNVTKSTIGDMVYLVNITYNDSSDKKISLDNCIKNMLYLVEDYKKTGYPFLTWLGDIIVKDIRFDFTPYI